MKCRLLFILTVLGMVNLTFSEKLKVNDASGVLKDNPKSNLLKQSCPGTCQAGRDGRDGHPGHPGRDGCQGAPGPQGARGSQGPQGVKGAQGPEGPQGANGTNGEQGPRGPQGVKGSPGPQGPIGPKGLQGNNGTNGAPGPQGAQGPRGNQGPPGPVGPKGPQGTNGTNGPPGPQGAQGPRGSQGPQGVKGAPGPVGPHGTNGAQGPPGKDGSNGTPGKDGINGRHGKDAFQRNLKECAWRDLDSSVSTGFITECHFVKKYKDTSLMVSFTSNVFLKDCSRRYTACCKRWYMTFDGQECSPVPLDQVRYRYVAANPEHVPFHLKGLCKINKTGLVKVGINIKTCSGYGDAKATTGWRFATRMIIEEVRPQV